MMSSTSSVESTSDKRSGEAHVQFHHGLSSTSISKFQNVEISNSNLSLDPGPFRHNLSVSKHFIMEADCEDSPSMGTSKGFVT